MDLEDSVAWWSSLATLGGLLVTAGILVGDGLGTTVAIGGVALFLGTAVLSGAELLEGATALGVAGIVWTAAGISVTLGTDPSRVDSLVGLVSVGGAAVALGLLGAVRASAREARVRVREAAT